MDLNDFKSINDKYGHLVGDKYLSPFAQHMQEEVCEMGIVYRISGDEFLLLCAPLQDNMAEQENIIRSVSFAAEEFGRFKGISLGAACYPQDGNNFDRLLAIADRRMYEDKRKKA